MYVLFVWYSLILPGRSGMVNKIGPIILFLAKEHHSSVMLRPFKCYSSLNVVIDTDLI